MNLRIFYIIISTVFYLPSNEVNLGNVHTSISHLSDVVLGERKIIHYLEKYVKKEMKRISVIQRYIASWENTAVSNIVNNPLNSYHFIRRVQEEYRKVQDALSTVNTVQAQENVRELHSRYGHPERTDVEGAAWALIKLQDIYNLTLDDLVKGKVKGAKAFKGLSAEDCLSFGEQSFKNLEFDLSSRWTKKAKELFFTDEESIDGNGDRMDKIDDLINQRIFVQNLLMEMLDESGENMLDQFSGLGLPFSLQKEIHKTSEEKVQLEYIEESYRALCQGEGLQVNPLQKDYLICTYHCIDQSLYGMLMPFKLEMVSIQPTMFLYHEALSEREMAMLRNLAAPKLKTTEVHSFSSHRPMESLARIGKTAWIMKEQSKAVGKILGRTELMTGLNCKATEDLHVLNYGIGGYYDLHVDFFDSSVKMVDPSTHFGDRFATILFYLNDVEAGGATVFPGMEVRILASKGTALMWFNLKRNGRGDYNTLHASCPVLLGQKWIANLWVLEHGQEFKWPCTTDPNE